MCNEKNWFSEIVYDKDVRLKKDYITPIVIDLDSQYKSELESFMDKLHDELVTKDETEKYATIVSRYKGFFSEMLESQYSGDLESAHKLAKEVLDDLKAEDESIAFSTIKQSMVFSDIDNVIADDRTMLYDDDEESTIQFYRAKVSDTYTKYTRPEMLHVPFDKRQFVANERFSISGFPCLYLCSSSYCCWLELGTPKPQHFNVSYFQVDENEEILNLTMNASELECFVSSGASEKKIITAFKLWLVSVATSYIVKEKGRTFKSEYVISQLLMLACKNSGCYGISYYSKRVDSDFFAYRVCVNLAIFAPYKGERKVSDVCNGIKLTESMNFEMFKNLQPSLTYRQKHLNVVDSCHAINIGNFERQYPYRETEFYAFDKYLATYLEKELMCIDVDEANA